MKEKTLTIINQIEQLEVLAKDLEAISDEWNIPMNIVLNLNLVLEELITNIIFYGYEDKNEHNIIIRLSYNGKIIQIQIEDDAIEFNPLLIVEPDIDKPLENRTVGGLGMHFVRKLTDNITYERTNNKNILTLTKNIA